MICIRSLGYQAATFPILAKIEALSPQNSQKWLFVEQYSVNLYRRCRIFDRSWSNFGKRNGIFNRSWHIFDTRNHFFDRRFFFFGKRSHILDRSYDVFDKRTGFLDRRFRVFDTRKAVSNAFSRILGYRKAVSVPMSVLCNSSHYFLITGKTKISFELMSPVSVIRNCLPSRYKHSKLSRMYKVLISFTTSNYSDAELIVKASEIVKGVTNNSNFPTPSPAIDEVETARVAYSDALAASNSGDHQAVAVKNEQRKVLENLLHDLGMYVIQTGKGDEKILLSSGFDLSKKAEAAGPLDAPENLQVHPAKSKRTVEVTCNRVAHANSYSIEYRNLTTPNGTATAFATKPKVLITGLISGNQYAFRVLAVGTDSQRNWSDEVNSFVL